MDAMTVLRTFCNGQWFEVADGLPRYDDRELEALQSLADAVYGWQRAAAAGSEKRLARWAADKAPTLDRAGWRRYERQAIPAFPGCALDEQAVAQAKALLDFRDKLATALPSHYVNLVVGGSMDYGGRVHRMAPIAEAQLLGTLGLMEQGDDGLYSVTAFGREVARVRTGGPR